MRPEGKLHSHRHESVSVNALLRTLQHWILNGGDGRRVAIHAILLNEVECFQQFLLMCIEGEGICKADDVDKCSICKNHGKMQRIDKNERKKKKTQKWVSNPFK